MRGAHASRSGGGGCGLEGARRRVGALRQSSGARNGERQLPRGNRGAVGQIASLQSAIGDLGARSALDPNLARAMERLPALVKARAMGGGVATDATPKGQEPYLKALSAIAGPEDTFGLLRTLLEGLESRS